MQLNWKKVSLRRFPVLGIVLLAWVVASPATASVCPAPEIFGPIANPHLEGTVIFWDPLVSFQTLTLRVSAPCGDVVRTFKQGETPFFDIREVTREIDGRYAWELTAQPLVDPAVQEQLARVRGTPEEEMVIFELWDKGMLPRGPFRQAGAFHVVQGLIEDPTVPEKGAGLRSPISDVGLSAHFPGSNGGSNGGVSGGVEMAGSSSVRNISAADFVIIDDLIVDGSACIGFDCVNGESFGFDTIRLKENNLRIKFDDTSTAASFPRNDWQITANDSANGGASKFSIDDISGSRTPFTIEANARSHSLYVDDGGRLGLRTSTPSTEIHTVDGDTPTLRLQQDGSSGFAPQTWDVAGNETNFFIRDVTNGSQLPFRIRPDAPTSSIDIASDGDVGIGTASPAANLDIQSSGNTELQVTTTGTNSTTFSLTTTTNNAFFGTSTSDVMAFTTDGTERMRITTTGRVAIGCSNPTTDFVVQSTSDGVTTCATSPFSSLNAGDTSFTTSSSRTLKQNLKPIPAEGILAKIQGIDVYHYDFIDGPKSKIGLMAEDFHQVFQHGSDEMLNGQEVQMALWLAVQELAERADQVSDLEKEKDALLSRQEQLEKEVEGLKEMVATFVKVQN